MSKEWYNINSIKTAEEMIIRNTYLNSLLKTQKRNLQYKIDNINNPQYKMKYNDKNHVKWGNINEENKNDNEKFKLFKKDKKSSILSESIDLKEILLSE